jgi:anthranilate synthase component 2
MILLIDNYDSFTYNIYQYLAVLGEEVVIYRNDKITLDEIATMKPDKIVISPGPKSPKEAGICIELIKRFYKEIPILGICLGHQSIGEAFGATVSYAKELCHGIDSDIEIAKGRLFEGLPKNIKVARYHSLAIIDGTLSDEFIINAKTIDGEIMAIEHKEYPLFGLQFHPESIYTPKGMDILRNFVKGNY